LQIQKTHAFFVKSEVLIAMNMKPVSGTWSPVLWQKFHKCFDSISYLRI